MFGVVLFELLIDKTMFQDLVLEHSTYILTWVRSVRKDETDSGDDHASSALEDVKFYYRVRDKPKPQPHYTTWVPS